MIFTRVKTPPDFKAVCIVCFKIVETHREPLYANIEGETLKAYYCDLCAYQERKKEEWKTDLITGQHSVFL